MNNDVNYTLDYDVREEIKKTKEVIMESIGEAKIYLFGSIAKGRYSKTSDIDILVLINEDIDTKKLRRIRNIIEDTIEERNIKRNVDIKLYNERRFMELTKNISFEKDILKDLINIGGW